mmetsp:Transcript_31301/g.108213  ORF Transcript_31301/g.108213 Transcript_31301/m.108213 type:complete len:124 (-) Transcript_31301:74-445(-)
MRVLKRATNLFREATEASLRNLRGGRTFHRNAASSHLLGSSSARYTANAVKGSPTAPKHRRLKHFTRSPLEFGAFDRGPNAGNVMGSGGHSGCEFGSPWTLQLPRSPKGPEGLLGAFWSTLSL